jgi:transcriptional regulator with XRE-family HTH domain
MSLNYHLLGKKIQQLRREQKIPQLKFAEMIETSSTFVSRMERGLRGPSLETLVMIADVLDASLDSLLAESRERPQDGHLTEIIAVLKDCNTYERFVMLQSLKEIKRILREGESILKQNNHSVF